MKIVQFKSGLFALRKWSMLRGWVYLDPSSQVFPWVGKRNSFFSNCLHYSADDVRACYGGWLDERERRKARRHKMKVRYKVIGEEEL